MKTYTHNSNSAKAVVILHEIYGVNEHIKKVIKEYFEKGYDVFVPNLLNREKPYSYMDQDKAYYHFKEHIGFDVYHRVIATLNNLRPNYRNILLIGFSVGGTIAWRCADSGLCDGIIAYYGSRIRDYLEVSPKCPSLLIFAKDETSFNPEDIFTELQAKEMTTVKILDGNHGFCDAFSQYYHPESAKEAQVLEEKFCSDIMNQK